VYVVEAAYLKAATSGNLLCKYYVDDTYIIVQAIVTVTAEVLKY